MCKRRSKRWVLVSVLKIAIAINEKATEKNRIVLTWVKKTFYERVDSAAGSLFVCLFCFVLFFSFYYFIYSV